MSRAEQSRAVEGSMDQGHLFQFAMRVDQNRVVNINTSPSPALKPGRRINQLSYPSGKFIFNAQPRLVLKGRRMHV